MSVSPRAWKGSCLEVRPLPKSLHCVLQQANLDAVLLKEAEAVGGGKDELCTGSSGTGISGNC